MDDIPFDLRALRIIVYDKNAPNWGKLLKDKIENSILEVEKAPTAAVLPAFLEVQSAPKPNVTSREKEILEIRQELDRLRREMLISSRNEEPGQSQIFGSSEARELIGRLVKAGLPTRIIVHELESRGVPRFFIDSELKHLRPRRRSKPSPLNE
jgi:hypothetical protein